MKKIHQIILLIGLVGCSKDSLENQLKINHWENIEGQRWVKTVESAPFVATTFCKVENSNEYLDLVLDLDLNEFSYRIECPSDTIHNYPNSIINKGIYYEEFKLNYENKTVIRNKNLSAILFYPEQGVSVTDYTDYIENISFDDTGDIQFTCEYNYETDEYGEVEGVGKMKCQNDDGLAQAVELFQEFVLSELGLKEDELIK